LLALIAMQWMRYDGAQVFFFDKGRSARAAILGLGGTHLDLGAEGSLAFQPLRRIDELGDRTFALDWLVGLAAKEGVEITPDVKEALWSALKSLATAPESERTLTGLTVLLQSAKLAQALRPYTLDGPYGRLLDADTDNFSLAPVQCFEMEELMHQPGLVAPVITFLFHRLEDAFGSLSAAGSASHPTLLVLDEAWVFLDDPLFAGRIREWLKVLRKMNVAVVFATQSLADIEKSTIAPALIESCPTRLFLPNERAIEPQQRAVYERFGLNDRQIDLIAGALPKRDYYLQSPKGARVFELGLGPLALAFCAAGSPEDQALIDRLLAAHGSEEFAFHYLNERNLSWAADLLNQWSADHRPDAS
jgi:type IV secretion system protein VirB4